MTLICLQCGATKETAHNWIEDHEQTCEKCWAVKQWRKPGELQQEPTVAYELNHNDRMFLRSYRISPE